jgi:hypothetical protein
MAYSECLPTRLNPVLAERACFSQVCFFWTIGGFYGTEGAPRRGRDESHSGAASYISIAIFLCIIYILCKIYD